MKNKKDKGFTLIEILITIGLISIASTGLYATSNLAEDWKKSGTEVKNLSMLIKKIDNSTATIDNYNTINFNELNYISNLDMVNVKPIAKKLNFIYKNVNSRICNDFTNKMLATSKNINSIVNDKELKKDDLKNISLACSSDNNDITIVLNKSISDLSINTVVASVNLPKPPTPEIVIPTFPDPEIFPTLIAFTPTATPASPYFPTTPAATPTSPYFPTTPAATPTSPYFPTATPTSPYFPTSPAPAPTSPAPDNSLGNTLYKCRLTNPGNGINFFFNGKAFPGSYNNEFLVKEYFDIYGGLGTYKNSIYDTFVKPIYFDILDKLKTGQDLGVYKNAYCIDNMQSFT